MLTDERPSLRDEIVDAVEDEEALLKSRIERFGLQLWTRLLAAGRAIRGASRPRRHRPF